MYAQEINTNIGMLQIVASDVGLKAINLNNSTYTNDIRTNTYTKLAVKH